MESKKNSGKNNLGETIKNNYQLTDREALLMRDLFSLVENNADDFVREFYDFIFKFDHAEAFLKNDKIIELHNVKIREWLFGLFCGNYDADYFAGLKHISEAHSRIGLPTHYINASFNFVRRFLLRMLVESNRLEHLDVIEKVIDINLDVLTSAYLLEDTRRIIKTIKSIKKALDTSSVVPFYQPIIDNSNGAVVKYECLVRIIEEDGTVIAPMDFLPIAKQVKLYPDITREVLKHAFADHGKLKTPFSINLSVDDIENEEITAFIYQLLREQPQIGSELTFELLESEQVENYELVNEFIRAVKKFKVKIAIDDFGTGFSNIDHLTRIKIDYLKIDGSLIRNLPDNGKNRIAVDAIVSFAEKMGVETIAEFVHSQGVHLAVKDAGVDYSQGFFLGKPEPIQKIVI
ncbi:MAG: EAL domain-containing protein [Desulfobacteraceae bacterium]|nr:EAL domain-containing protein [Desulfobacteraceae bacterium]